MRYKEKIGQNIGHRKSCIWWHEGDS